MGNTIQKASIRNDADADAIEMKALRADDIHRRPEDAMRRGKGGRKGPIPASPTNGILSELIFLLRYIRADYRARPRMYSVGVSTVVLVLVFVTVLENAILASPVIFMKLTEDTVGEYDVFMTPRVSNQSTAFWLNYTELEPKLQTAKDIVGSSPRWNFIGRVSDLENRNKNLSVIVLIIDSAKEQQIGLGRGWNRRPLGEQECYLSGTVLRHLNVTPQAGERVNLYVDPLVVLAGIGLFGAQQAGQASLGSLLGDNASNNATVQVNLTTLLSPLGINVPPGTPPVEVPVSTLQSALAPQLAPPGGLPLELIVTDGVEDPKGKWPQALGNVIVLEKKYLPDLLADAYKNVASNIPLFALLSAGGVSADQLETAIRNINLDEFALNVVAMYKNRTTMYVKDQNDAKLESIALSNQVAEAIGLDFPAVINLPVSLGLGASYFIRLFLDQLFIAVVAILLVLSSMLIYSLLLSDVEGKTYEYGMLRALGMEHNTLIRLLVFTALSFSIPGLVFGLVIASLLNIPGVWFIADYSLTTPDYNLKPPAVILAVSIAILIPLVSNIVPIKRALTKTLRDALDLYHEVNNEVTVRTIRLEKLGLSPWQTSLSLVLVGIGFVTYYLIPYAFIFNNLPLFLTILIFILLGMVFGLALVAVNFQPPLERIILKVSLWGRSRRLGDLVSKNLAGHRARNLKTALMFTTALSFVIFAASMFALQADNIGNQISAQIGTDVQVTAPEWSKPLASDSIREYLINEPDVDSFSFVTFALNNHPKISRTTLSTLVGYPSAGVTVYGVGRKFLKPEYNQYYKVSMFDPAFEPYLPAPSPAVDPDLIDSLYRDAGKARVIEDPKTGPLYAPPYDIVSGAPENYESASTLPLRTVQGGTTTESAYVKYVDLVASAAMKDALSVEVGTPLRVKIRATQKDPVKNVYVNILGKARGLVSKVPGYFFSSYRQTASGSPVLVAEDEFYRLLNVSLNALNNAPSDSALADNSTVSPNVTVSGNSSVSTQDLIGSRYRSVNVKLKDGFTQAIREKVTNSLRNFIPDDGTQLVDTIFLVGQTTVAVSIINVFFYIVSAIATVLNFFGLWLSFVANMRENQWEYGVLRAVGLTEKQTVLIYIYEAIVLISASVILGSIIGIMIAISLQLQFNLFTELPFVMTFPTPVFLAVVFMALFAAVLGSFLPAKQLKKKEVAIVLKG